MYMHSCISIVLELHVYVFFLVEFQRAWFYQLFLVILGTVNIARLCSIERKMWSIMSMLLQLEGLQELIL